MLVLTRKQRQQICIGDQITITILRVKGQAVRLGIEAPENVRVLRGELVDSRGEVDGDRTSESNVSGESQASSQSTCTATSEDCESEEAAGGISTRRSNTQPASWERAVAIGCLDKLAKGVVA